MRKTLIITIVFLTFLSAFYNAFAFDIGTKEIKDLGDCGYLLTYDGIPKRTNYVGYEKDGKIYPAYCLNIDLLGVGYVDAYSVSGESKIKDEKVWKAIINGFPYKSLSELGVETEEEAFTATKNAVYTMIYNRDPNKYGPVDSEEGRRTYAAYLKIIEAAKASTEILQDKIETCVTELTDEWKVDDVDKNYVSKTYMLNSNVELGFYRIELEGDLPEGISITDMNNNLSQEFKVGNSFKIIIPIKNLVEDGNFEIKAVSSIESKPIVYGATSIPGTQDYALTGYAYEESVSNLSQEFVKNNTKLTIIKKENGTENRLVGVKFNLLDENQNIVKENLTTDENGKIVLEKTIPGTYYLQEVETLAGFVLNPELTKIELGLNDEIEVTVNNTLKEVPIVEKEVKSVEISPKQAPEIVQTEVVTPAVTTGVQKKLPVTGY